MKNILFFILSFSLLTLSFSLFPSSIFAQIQPLPASTYPGAEGVVEISAFSVVFSNVLTVATSLSGIAAFVVLIMGGFNWMTSGGDPKKLESAKSTVTYAFVGLALLIGIWLILSFIEQFTGVPVTIFKFPQ